MGAWEDREEFAARPPERRSDARYSVDEESVVLFVGYGSPQPARLVDLSQEGCRLRTKEAVTARRQLPVEVFFKVNGFSFRFRGVMQWTDGHNLVGIRFVNVVPRRMVELASVICGMEETAASRADAVNLLVAEKEVPRLPGGETAAWDGGRNREPIASAGKELAEAAPHAPADGRQPAGQVPAGRERRQQTRHEVDTTATILLVNVGSILKGRILDLSLAGCRIRTDERFPVGIYTRVETEFRLEGLPFRLGGVIQAIHNRNTVGIRFLDLSDRKRNQVLDLIGEIELLRASQPAAAQG
jgi:PilZ domain